MARFMAADDAELFRAVVTTTRTGERWKDGKSVITQVVGPYRTRAAALQAISREERAAESSNHTEAWYARTRQRVPEVTTVEGYVERATVTWERVP